MCDHGCLVLFYCILFCMPITYTDVVFEYITFSGHPQKMYEDICYTVETLSPLNLRNICLQIYSLAGLSNFQIVLIQGLNSVAANLLSSLCMAYLLWNC